LEIAMRVVSSFESFYREVFLPEHQHPVNVALHVLGTLAGLVWLVWALWAPGGWKWAALLFPLVHGAPGLLGHRLLERSAAVGDARWRRTDHAPWKFIVANHRLTWDCLARAPMAAWRRARAAPPLGR
jgi:hypothetical protein